MKRLYPVLVFLSLSSFAHAQLLKGSRAEITDSIKFRGTWLSKIVSDGRIVGDSFIVVQNGLRLAYPLPKTDTSHLRGDINAAQAAIVSNTTQTNSNTTNIAAHTAAIANKDDIFSVVPYNTVLKFSTNKSSALHVQSAPETFSVATDTMFVGKSIQLSIQSSGDSLLFDTSKFSFDQNIKPQFIAGKINDFLFTLMANGKVQTHISTRAANYANIVYSTKLGFTTQAGYMWQFIYIKNPTTGYINLSAGTSSGASDIFNQKNLMPGASIIYVQKPFDNATPIYFSFPAGVTIQYGLNATTANQTL